MKYLPLLLLPLMVFLLAGCGKEEIPTDESYKAPEEVNYAEPHSNGPTGLPDVEGPTEGPPVE